MSTGQGKGKKAIPVGTKPAQSISSRTGLTFPVGRISRQMKDGGYATRVGAGAPIFLAAVLEYLTGELLESAGNKAKETGKHRITPQHIVYAIRGDAEMDQLLSAVTISNGGVIPRITERPGGNAESTE